MSDSATKAKVNPKGGHRVAMAPGSRCTTTTTETTSTVKTPNGHGSTAAGTRCHSDELCQSTQVTGTPCEKVGERSGSVPGDEIDGLTRGSISWMPELRHALNLLGWCVMSSVAWIIWIPLVVLTLSRIKDSAGNKAKYLRSFIFTLQICGMMLPVPFIFYGALGPYLKLSKYSKLAFLFTCFLCVVAITTVPCIVLFEVGINRFAAFRIPIPSTVAILAVVIVLFAIGTHKLRVLFFLLPVGIVGAVALFGDMFIIPASRDMDGAAGTLWRAISLPLMSLLAVVTFRGASFSLYHSLPVKTLSTLFPEACTLPLVLFFGRFSVINLPSLWATLLGTITFRALETLWILIGWILTPPHMIEYVNTCVAGKFGLNKTSPAMKLFKGLLEFFVTPDLPFQLEHTNIVCFAGTTAGVFSCVLLYVFTNTYVKEVFQENLRHDVTLVLCCMLAADVYFLVVLCYVSRRMTGSAPAFGLHKFPCFVNALGMVYGNMFVTFWMAWKAFTMLICQNQSIVKNEWASCDLR
ncbi:hypothetical protein Pelo_5990 [Pelomyxa schiedti]|nr:hypothetical protein Pelo_5990 [Pelomyxa schiedti]